MDSAAVTRVVAWLGEVIGLLKLDVGDSGLADAAAA